MDGLGLSRKEWHLLKQWDIAVRNQVRTVFEQMRRDANPSARELQYLELFSSRFGLKNNPRDCNELAADYQVNPHVMRGRLDEAASYMMDMVPGSRKRESHRSAEAIVRELIEKATGGAAKTAKARK